MQKPWQFRRNFHLAKNCRIWASVSKSQLKNSKTPFHNADRSTSETKICGRSATLPVSFKCTEEERWNSWRFSRARSGSALCSLTSLSLTMIPKTKLISCFNASLPCLLEDRFSANTCRNINVKRWLLLPIRRFFFHHFVVSFSNVPFWSHHWFC